MKMRLATILLLFGLALGQGCHDGSGAGGNTAAVAFSELFPLTLGGATVQVQVALDKTEQRRGLMFRESLDDGQGMLFPYREPQPMSFWMENVAIALDVGFFDSEGVLREIHHMLPYDRQSVRSSARDLRYALEVNKDWFARNKVMPGARLDRAQLAAALKARGADPADYGL